eukprot:3358214-Amphidinium_carterae.2
MQVEECLQGCMLRHIDWEMLFWRSILVTAFTIQARWRGWQVAPACPTPKGKEQCSSPNLSPTSGNARGELGLSNM